jgi:hypothetical protein
MMTGEIALNAAFQVANLLQESWNYYQTVVLAVLGWLVFSQTALPRPPRGAAAFIIPGLAMSFAINWAVIVQQGQRLDALLKTAGSAFGHSGLVASRPTFLDTWVSMFLSENMFEFRWEYSAIAHIVVDVSVLGAVSWVMLFQRAAARAT